MSRTIVHITVYFELNIDDVSMSIQVSRVIQESEDITGNSSVGNRSSVADSGDVDDDDGGIEYLVIEDQFYYLEPLIRIFSLLHMSTSFCMLVAYYCLKVSTRSLCIIYLFHSIALEL